MLRTLLMAASIALSVLTGWSQESSQNVSVIPEPVQLVQKPGTFRLHRETTIVSLDRELLSSARYLSDYVNNYLGCPLKVEQIENEPGSIVLVNKKNGEVPGGYQLIINPDGVEVQGNDAAGVFYGVQTVIQLLPTRAGVLPVLPALEITD